MNDHKKVAVVIPVYQEKLSAFEQIALQQCNKILSNHHKVIIKPQSLTLPQETSMLSLTDVECFNDDYFRNIQGYNRLMLSEEFYERFMDYEYILIYQLDASVFRDDLDYWCDQDIDYIGAPWLRKEDFTSIFKALKSRPQYYLYARFNIKKNGLPDPKQFYKRVGNGGFSLRRVKKFHDLCIKMQDQIQIYIDRDEHHFNEDAFWSIEVNRKRKLLNIPGYKDGLKFSFELEPECAYKLNHQKLPFGCHAWNKHLDFWRPFFEQYGYFI
jgi:Protein of unknown function (DUF5672)